MMFDAGNYWFAMKELGPSLAEILKSKRNNIFSLKTSV